MGNVLNGLVAVKAAVLTKACEGYLDTRNTRIDAAREDMIAKYPKSTWRWSWFRRITHFYTRDEIIALLKVNFYGFSAWMDPEWEDKAVANHIAELWHATKMTQHDQDIFVTTLNLARLFDHMPKVGT